VIQFYRFLIFFCSFFRIFQENLNNNLRHPDRAHESGRRSRAQHHSLLLLFVFGGGGGIGGRRIFL
jgi:hypothetical protein